MDIKELIIMYAPTVFMAVSVILNYLKTFKALSTNVSKIENSRAIKSLSTEVENLKKIVSTQTHYLSESEASNIQLREAVEKLTKELEDEKDSKNETTEEEKVLVNAD